MRRSLAICVFLATCLLAALLPAAASEHPTLGPTDQSTKREVSSEDRIPRPDPRYEHDRFVQVESPQVILDGGMLADESNIKHVTAVREAVGLVTERELAIQLLEAPGSAQIMRDQGVLLTSNEQGAWNASADFQQRVQDLDERARSMPGYFNVEMTWKGSLSPGQVIVRGTSDFISAVTPIAREMVPDHAVSSVETLSRAELEDIRAFMTGRSSREAQLLPSEVRELAADIGTVPVVNFDPQTGDIIVQGSQTKGSRPAGAYLPAVHFRPLLPTEPEVTTLGIDPCQRFGCLPNRSGVELERNASDNECTFGPAVIGSGAARYMLTAGHCQKTSIGADAQIMQRGPVPVYTTTYFNRLRDLWVGVFSRNTYENNFEIDAVAISVPAWAATNRMRALSEGVQVQGIGNATVGSKVCHSGANVNLGVACGTVLETGFDGQTATTNFFFFDHVRTSYVSTAGDSGGPVFFQFSQNAIVGLHQGSVDTPINGQMTVQHGIYGRIQNLDEVDSSFSVYTLNDPRRDFVNELYQGVLQRTPTYGEWLGWRASLNGCQPPQATAIARGFFLSPEFRNLYPIAASTSRKAVRIELLYRVLLGRSSDTPGLNDWVNLFTGNNTADLEDSWTLIVNSFSTQQEYMNRAATGASHHDGRFC